MRGLSTLYLCACEKEGCLSNSKLVKFFAELDQYSPSDTITDERQKMNWLGHEVDHTNSQVEASLVDRACPTTLDFTQNYLGDAGLAAVFRVLPLMRWVKKVIAQGCGAGPKSVKALCDVLTMELPTVFDSTKGATLGIPLIALECVDLRSNSLYVASGRQLIKALEARRRVSARHDADLPPMEVLVDYENMPYTISCGLSALNRTGHDDKKRRELTRKRQKEREQQQLFCVESSGVPQPTGENVIYRIPEYMPNESSAPDAAPLLFYNSADPRLARLVREMNQHMEDYLVAFKCLSKRSVNHDGSGEIENARAAVQICVDLGADTLSFIPFTNASVWYEDLVRRPPPAVAVLAEEEMRRTASSGRLSYRESMEHRKSIDEVSREAHDRREKLEERKKEIELRYAEINVNVSSLLRGFYANPHLEMEIAKHRSPTLLYYINRLRELFYEGTAVEGDPLSVADRMQLLEALYNRVVAALTTKSMADLPSMCHFEERLSDIRIYMVEEMLMGTEVEDLMRLQRSIRQELIPPVPYETARWIADARSSQLPPPREWSEEEGGDKTTKTGKEASPYRRVWPLWCTQMKYYLFNNTAQQRVWNKEYVPKERRRWIVPLPRGRFRSARRETSTTIASALQTPRRWTESRQTPYQVRGSSEDIPARQESEHRQPHNTSGLPEDDADEVTEEEEEYELLRRSSKRTIGEEEVEEEFCYEEEEDEEEDEVNTTQESPISPVYRSLVWCTCQQRLGESFPARPPTSARRTCLPRPCPSCCYSSLAILPEFFRDALVLERLEIQQKVRDALPMELKVFFVDMILRRRSRSAYVPRVFRLGTRLLQEDGEEEGFLLPRSPQDDLPKIPARKLVSIMDFFAAVDGKRDRMLEVLAGFEEWYRLKMVESFDVAYPYLARPRFGRRTVGK